MATRTPKARVASVSFPPTANTEAVPSVYINNVEILTAGAVDVRIGFNEVLAERENRYSVVRRANVVMSKTHFIAMMHVLNDLLRRVATQEELDAVSAQFANVAKPPSA